MPSWCDVPATPTMCFKMAHWSNDGGLWRVAASREISILTTLAHMLIKPVNFKYFHFGFNFKLYQPNMYTVSMYCKVIVYASVVGNINYIVP